MEDMLEGDEDLLRRYLLGETSAEEEDSLEQRLLQDDQLFKRAEDAEADLLAEYARGELTPEQRNEILRRWSATAGGRARLSLARGLTRIAGEPMAEPSQPSSVPAPSVIRFPQPVPPRPTPWYRSVASLAAVLLLFVGASVAYRIAQYNGPVAPGTGGHIAQAPTPPILRPAPPPGPVGTPPVAVTPSPAPVQAHPSPPIPEQVLVEVVSLAFSGISRGPEDAGTITRWVRQEAREIDFQLPTDGETDDYYQVSLEHLDTGDKVFQGQELHPVSLTPGSGLRFKVPAEQVPEGRYQIEVRGVTAGQVSPIPLVDQSFEIRKK